MLRLLGLCLAMVLLLSALTYAGDVVVNGFVQYQYTAQQKTLNSSNFALKAARLKGSMKLTDKISAMVLIDGAKQPSVLEANVEYAFAPYLNLRLGQFQLPFGYETQNSNFDVEAIDRSQIVNGLWYNGTTYGYLRDQGLMLMGQHTLFNYKVACVNGSGLNTADNNNHKDIVGRIGVGIPMFAGLGVSMLEGKWGPQNDLQDRNALGFDLFLDTGKVLLESEYISAKGIVNSLVKDVKYSGYYAIVGYRVTPLIEPVFKFDKLDPNKDQKDDETTNLYFGVNLNFEGKARLQTFYVVKQEAKNSYDNNVFMMQVQGKF